MAAHRRQQDAAWLEVLGEAEQQKRANQHNAQVYRARNYAPVAGCPMTRQEDERRGTVSRCLPLSSAVGSAERAAV